MNAIWPIGLGASMLIAMTFAPTLKIDHWVIRSMDFPRLQITTLLLIILFAELVFLDLFSPVALVLLVLTLTATIHQLRWIIPYTPFSNREVQNAQRKQGDFTIKLLTTNVLMTNQNSGEVLRLIDEHQPDIVVTLETNAWWQEQLQPLERTYPHQLQCPLENLYGMHVYSRLPLQHPQIKFLVEEDIPSMHAALELPDGQMARLHFLHPAPPSPTENEASTERDAELLVLAEELKDAREPVIVAGDLNDVAWSRTTRAFRRISGLLDPRIGRGTYNTFHTKYWMLRWPLDHLFHSHHFSLLTLKRLRDIGSDHFPLLSVLKYDPGNGQFANKEDDPEEERWAKTKISEERVDTSDVPNPAQPS